MVWCWVAAPRDVASQYQISVEVMSKAGKQFGRDKDTLKAKENVMETPYEEDERKKGFEENRRTFKNKDANNHINADEHNNAKAKKHVGTDKVFHDSLTYAEDTEENGSDHERWADIPIGDSSSSREDLASFVEADEPLLTLAAEVMSLIQDPWSQVVSSGRSLFLSEKLLQQDVQVRVSIGLRYAEPTN